MFQTEVEEKIAIHFLCSRKNSFFLIRVVFEVMWETNLQPDAPQMRKHIACFITTDTNAHSEYVIFLPFHCKIDCTNAPQYYVTRASPVVLDTELKRVNKRNWAESGRGGRVVRVLRINWIQISTSFEPDYLVRFLIPMVDFAPSASQMLSCWRSYPHDPLLLTTQPPVQSPVTPCSAISVGFPSSFLEFFLLCHSSFHHCLITHLPARSLYCDGLDTVAQYGGLGFKLSIPFLWSGSSQLNKKFLHNIIVLIF